MREAGDRGREREKGRERVRERQGIGEGETERARNSEPSFYKDCSLGSVKT